MFRESGLNMGCKADTVSPTKNITNSLLSVVCVIVDPGRVARETVRPKPSIVSFRRAIGQV
jgi:hypothetical protein